jgi:uncharacterized protein (TIGR03086 family)
MNLPATDVPDRYRRLASHFTAVVNAVPSASWNRPSPCHEWTALDVLSHVASTQLDLLGRMPFAPKGLVASVDLVDPLTAWPIVCDLVQGALDTPSQAGCSYEGYFGPTTFADTISSFYNADLVLHAWDIAQAADLPEHLPIDPTEILRIRSDFVPYNEMIRMPGIFGPEQEVGAHASEQERFLAWSGRRPC